MRVARAALMVVGVLTGAYGALLLLQLDLAALVSVAVWMLGGAVLHDAVVAPLTVAVTLLLLRVVGHRWRTPLTVGAMVLLLVTATAVPVLGRFGARDDNPTLLDRDYVSGWLVLAALSLAVVVVLRVRESLRSGRPATGSEQHVPEQAD